MKKILLLQLILILILSSSCVKDIEVDVPDYKERLCVDAKIEQGGYATVFLTKNAPYFGDYDINALLNYVVTDAFITITDGTTTDTLIHLAYGYYYGNSLQGQVGGNYTLTIVQGSKTYTANTTIPVPVPLDSLWFQVQGNLDSLGYIWAHISEPGATVNYYRWFAMRLNKDAGFIAPFGSAIEDRFFDGQEFDFAYNRGRAPNSDADDDNNGEAYYFKVQDTVVIKYTSIDEASFDFWRSYETQVASEGNPFAAPGSIKSNILPAGEALGVFCGYGVFLDTLITQ